LKPAAVSRITVSAREHRRPQRCRRTSISKAGLEFRVAHSRTKAMSSVICLNMAAIGKSEQIIFLEVRG
jgi:hypothetical protein